MGSLQAHEMAGAMNLEQGIKWHLSVNHYPPVPASMVPVCIRAIKAWNKGDRNSSIRLPAGMEYRGKNLAPVHQVIEAHHLGPWLEPDDEDSYYDDFVDTEY